MEHHIQFDADKQALVLLDQRFLPQQEDWFVCKGLEDTIYALQTMVVRGAPAIGVTAAYGCWLCAQEVKGKSHWEQELRERLDKLAQARPTAVNLVWAVNLMRSAWEKQQIQASLDQLSAFWLDMAKKLHSEDIAINRKMGAFGAEVLGDGDTVMTHCNAGALATAGHGTALGVIYSAVEQGKKIKVIANETRPFLQGARLTAYELHLEGVEVKVACDNATALLMKKGLVQKVVVGADRIAANGDAANKIGTYGVALLAREHGVPFYVAAPSSTFDLDCAHGDLIPIEDRTPREVTHVGEVQIVPDGVEVYNFAFDVTPARLITGIITEKGIIYEPDTDKIREMLGNKH